MEIFLDSWTPCPILLVHVKQWVKVKNLCKSQPKQFKTKKLDVFCSSSVKGQLKIKTITSFICLKFNFCCLDCKLKKVVVKQFFRTEFRLRPQQTWWKFLARPNNVKMLPVMQNNLKIDNHCLFRDNYSVVIELELTDISFS